MDRAEAMAADGRRVGRLHGKRYVELLANGEARKALKRAIEAEKTPCHDAWGNGYVEGLRDALREFDARSNLGLLDH
jgi:hypothetical protein